MPLKPFACPLPETRFLHAGRRVYKFKIRYGHFSSYSTPTPHVITQSLPHGGMRERICVLGSAVAVIFLLLSSWCSAVVLTFRLGTALITAMF
uniref:Uncharacterized protein n=1 Tax=Amazona collaria TaxID=241587 RepID=A0A8B9F6R9_9PSIT